MLRFVCWIMFVVLLLCIAVQYNDPDGLAWALAYAYATVVTFFAARGNHSVAAPIGAVGYFIGFLAWMPGARFDDPSLLVADIQMKAPGVEEAREDIGLLICAVWMLILTIAWWQGRGDGRGAKIR